MSDRPVGDGGSGVKDDRIAELETRLAELRHGINNSLQMIVSLLQLQAQTAGPEVARALAVARGRVAAIGTLYETFDEDRDAKVDLGERVGRLVELQQAVAPERIELEFLQRSKPCLVRRSAAVTMLIVANELVTNAVQHAFPGDGGGHVLVELDGGGDDFRMSVTDNGIGIGTAWSSQTFGSGLRIATGLLSRAGGDLTHVAQGAGTRVEVRFDPSRLR